MKVVEREDESFVSEVILFTNRCSLFDSRGSSGVAARVGTEKSERSDHTSIEGFMLAAV